MSTTLYLMRHGETLFNVMRKMQGWCDSPLTADGIAQAKTAGAYLREQGLSFDYHCSSTLERACDTLETIMGELYGEVLPYERFKDLREHGFGMFEGVRYDIPPGRTLLERGDAEGVDIIHLLQGEDQRNVGPRMFRCLSQIMDQPACSSRTSATRCPSPMPCSTTAACACWTTTPRACDLSSCRTSSARTTVISSSSNKPLCCLGRVRWGYALSYPCAHTVAPCCTRYRTCASFRPRSPRQRGRSAHSCV